MEDADIKGVIRKLFRRWYWFVISIGLALAIAIIYLKITEEEYRVATTIQLKDQSLGDRGGEQEQFLRGFEFTQSGAELEDEIGILTSYTTIRQSLETLGFGVSYYAYPSALRWVAETVGEELYPPHFRVYLDTIGGHLLHTPVHISFPDAQHWQVMLETDDEPLRMLDGTTQQITEWAEEIDLDTMLLINQPLNLPYLSISLEINDSTEVFSDGTSYYLVLRSMDELTEEVPAEASD